MQMAIVDEFPEWRRGCGQLEEIAELMGRLLQGTLSLSMQLCCNDCRCTPWRGSLLMMWRCVSGASSPWRGSQRGPWSCKTHVGVSSGCCSTGCSLHWLGMDSMELSATPGVQFAGTVAS